MIVSNITGGQAKTLMFVQLNPDENSYSESISTLKFAERVSGVELGVARSSKEGRDVRELMEQVLINIFIGLHLYLRGIGLEIRITEAISMILLFDVCI